ncbi:MAG: GDP-mannose 4,6-dehydratase [Candidatus Sumerlaeia bacterium]|nr:GDP-mannose 4,6-dehydratase [Candidatus Sumerlaeia bacterium]
MKAIVTGCAGFIGSHLAEELLKRNYQVIGIDCFTDYYSRQIKEHNLQSLMKHRNFVFIAKNLLELDVKGILTGVDVIFHQAAQAGVRTSWGSQFQIYVNNNILATQCLLEALIDTKIPIIYASSSSVYGETKILPMREDHPTHPISPYGVSKLAAEHLCYLYWKNYDVRTISLRYFTVYGPRQRPDMAFHRFIKAMLKNEEITIYGTGQQTRDFTFIDDAVAANLRALESEKWGKVYNIGGGSRVTLSEVVKLLEQLMGKTARVKYSEAQHGDVTHTYADTTLARVELGFTPKANLAQGLQAEIEWVKNLIFELPLVGT